MANQKPSVGVLQLLAALTIVWALGMQVELMLFFKPVDPTTSMADLELAEGIETFNARLGTYPRDGVTAVWTENKESSNILNSCSYANSNDQSLTNNASEMGQYSRRISAVRTNTLLDFIFIVLYTSVFVYMARLFGSEALALRTAAQIAIGLAAVSDLGENIGLLRTLIHLGRGAMSSAAHVIPYTLAASVSKWVFLAIGVGFVGVMLVWPRTSVWPDNHGYSKRCTVAGYLALIAALFLITGIVFRFLNSWAQFHYLIGGGVLSLLLILAIVSWTGKGEGAKKRTTSPRGQPLDPMLQLATDYIYMLRGPDWTSQVAPELNPEIEKAIQELYKSDGGNAADREKAINDAVEIWLRQDERSIDLLAMTLYRTPKLALAIWSNIRAHRPQSQEYVPMLISRLATATYDVLTQSASRLPWKRRMQREIGRFKGDQQAVTRELMKACAPAIPASGPQLNRNSFYEGLVPVLIEKPLFMHWLARATGIAVPFSFVLDAELEEIENSRKTRRHDDPDAYIAATQKMEAMLRRFEERAARRKKHRTVEAEQRSQDTAGSIGFSGAQAHSSSTVELGSASAIPKMNAGVARSDLRSHAEEAEWQLIKKMKDRLTDLTRTKPSILSAPPPPSATGELYEGTNPDGSGGRESPIRRALRDKLFGIAFSGGGIRSATFNLGVLQALAEADVLRYADYLSAVSGGSYIAGWLVAWCKRQTDGVRRVQRWLAPWRSPDPRSQEVRPIWFLRRYSNYLTPKTSILSADTWTAVSIWLRNALLNQIILLLILISLLLVPWVLLGLYHGSYDPTTIMLAACLLAAASVLIGSGLSGFERDQFGELRQTVLPAWLEGQAGVQICIVLPLMVSAFIAATTLSSNHRSMAAWDWGQFSYASASLLISLLLAQISGRFHRCFVEHDTGEQSAAAKVGAFAVIFLFAALAASLGGALTILLISWIQSWPADYLITFAPPMFLLVLAAVVILHVGLLGINFPDERREWWARLAGWTVIYSVGWVIIFGISLFGTEIVESARWGWRLKSGAIMAWLGSTIWGLIKGYSSSTPAKGGNTSGTIAKIAMAIAPPIFIAGLLLILSYLIEKALPERPFVTSITALAVAAGTAIFFSWRVDVNEFSMHHFYRNRLMRAYLGASHISRAPNPFTGFDRTDDVQLSKLHTQAKGPNGGVSARKPNPEPYFGPYMLVNTALNVTGGAELAWQERMAESFVFGPLYSGFEYVGEEIVSNRELEPFGYRWTEDYAYRGGGVGLCTTMAISGAAVNPNMGYHSSPSLAFLMTLFNVRLGWWMGNPRHSSKWLRHSPRLGLMYLTTELTGSARDTSSYVDLSDGGHFDNLGLYELVRRRCRYIVVCDSEEDQKFDFGGLGNAVRKCRTDFNVDIQLSLDNIRPVELGDRSRVHCVFGDIYYPGPEQARGALLYIKASLTGNDDPVDVREYGWQNRAFPHQSTADQWFTESQFESYRELGHHIGEVAFVGIGPCPSGVTSEAWLAGLFEELQENWGTAPDSDRPQFEARMNINAAEGVYKLALNPAE